MPAYTRETLPKLLEQTVNNTAQVYLIFGERYLCQDAVEKIEHQLLQTPGTVHPVDGEHEDTATLVYKLRSFSLLPGRQIFRVTDTQLFFSKTVAKNIWKKVVKANQANKQEQVIRSLRAFLSAGGIKADTSENDLTQLSTQQWQHAFGFAKPDGDLSWIVEPLLKIRSEPAKQVKSVANSAEMLIECLGENIPSNNILLLVAEEVDKRKKLFKYFKEHHVVVDLGVETGSSAKAQKQQKSVLLALIQQTLQEMDKSIVPAVADRLIERVGFHPVAVVMELRKVMLYAGQRKKITQEDLDAVVGRTRQEALFELTSALTAKNIRQVLFIADRLQANGLHPLALIAALRNTTRSLLLFRSLQEQPRFGYTPSMSASAFQNQCLPILKEDSAWKKEFSGHPYALYMQFKTAANHPLPQLQHWLHLLLQTEMRLKGSPLTPQIILQHLFLSMLVH